MIRPSQIKTTAGFYESCSPEKGREAGSIPASCIKLIWNF